MVTLGGVLDDKLPQTIGIHNGHLFMGVRTWSPWTRYKNYVRRWEIWNKFSDIAIIIGKTLLSGRVWVAISHTIVARGKHNGDATSTYHSIFQQIT